MPELAVTTTLANPRARARGTGCRDVGMSIERTYICEGPCGEAHEGGTPTHVQTSTPPPYLPVGWIETREGGYGDTSARHFCSWDCVLRFAAGIPPGDVIPIGSPE